MIQASLPGNGSLAAPLLAKCPLCAVLFLHGQTHKPRVGCTKLWSSVRIHRTVPVSLELPSKAGGCLRGWQGGGTETEMEKTGKGRGDVIRGRSKDRRGPEAGTGMLRLSGEKRPE